MNDNSDPTAVDMVDDFDLVTRAQSGDATAMNALLTRHYSYVHAVCRRMLRNPADAEDARQEALIQACRMISKFEHRAKFRTWLHTLTRNVCLNFIRRNARLDIPADRVGEEPNAATSVLDTATARIDVETALAQVTPAFRDTLILRYMCDLEYADIAEVLHIPVNTVRTQLLRGRAQLIRILGEPEAPAAVSNPQGTEPIRNTERR